MRAFVSTLIICAAALLCAVPAQAHAHRLVHPMVAGLGHGLIHMLRSADRHPAHESRHVVHRHVAHRRGAHRYAERRPRKFAQPRLALDAAFTPFEPGPFSMLFGAGQTVIDAGISVGSRAVNEGARAAFRAGAGVIAGASAVADQVRAAAAAAGVPPSIALAVARFESRFNENARGRAGEIGDMQVLPRTARAMGCKDLRDHACVRAAGMRYLALALQQPGNMCEKLSAYNHGLGYRSCTSYGRNIERLAGLR